LIPEQGSDVLAHFGEDHFLERYQRYKAHIAEWRQQYPKLQAVDLRYDQQVVLEMDSGTNVAQASAAEQAAASTAAGQDMPSTEAPAEQAPEKRVPPADRPLSAKHKIGVPADRSMPVGHKTAAKPLQAVHAAADRPVAHKPLVKEKPAKTVAKAGRETAVKPEKIVKTEKPLKTSPKIGEAKSKEKKRAVEPKRAALDVSKRKTAPVVHSARIAGESK